MSMEILKAGAKSLGLTLGAQQIARFEVYYRELEAWNKRFNLTAITGCEEIQRRHFVDSLTCLLAFPSGASSASIPDEVPLQWQAADLRCADVGTGAGFPGVPLKIVFPDMRLTLIEATAKKVAFLEHIVKALGLSQVEVLHARAEDVGRLPEHREQYDVVLARAVAHLAVLAEYCLPLCRLGGRFIAPKGEDAPEEIAASEEAIALLGGALVAAKPITLPDVPGQRYLVVIDKIAKTPDRYPRRAGIPLKRPLP